MKESLRNSIYDLRQQNHVTQEELAAACGVTRQTIIAMEKGNYTPSLLLAFRIARFFGKKIEHIFTLL